MAQLSRHRGCRSRCLLAALTALVLCCLLTALLCLRCEFGAEGALCGAEHNGAGPGCLPGTAGLTLALPSIPLACTVVGRSEGFACLPQRVIESSMSANHSTKTFTFPLHLKVLGRDTAKTL